MIIDPIGAHATEILTDRTAGKTNVADRTSIDKDSGVQSTIMHDEPAVSSLVNAAMQTPNVRQERVDALRTSIAQADYAIEPAKIAATMLQDQLT